MRGEQAASARSCSASMGSPPHARGAGQRGACRGKQDGITPACAGSRPVIRRSSLGAGDHPRMRGEQEATRRGLSRTAGSPPHARGAVEKCMAGINSEGITPACAGSRSGMWCVTLSAGDHPRMRGEQGWIFAYCSE